MYLNYLFFLVWINEDLLSQSKNNIFLHSRRTFSNVRDCGEAESVALHWAVTNMNNTPKGWSQSPCHVHWREKLSRIPETLFSFCLKRMTLTWCLSHSMNRALIIYVIAQELDCSIISNRRYQSYWYHSNYANEWYLLSQIRGSIVVFRDRIHNELRYTIDPNQQWIS